MKVNFSDIALRVQEVVLRPKDFWEKRKRQEEGQPGLLGGYLLPILGIVAIAVFLGEFFRSSHFIVFAILKALREVLLFVLQYFIAVFFTNELMKTFGGEKNIAIARKLIAYSLTPFLVVSIITGLFQFLYVIDVLGIYSFYIFWVGGKELLALPQEKRDSYLLITIVVNFFIFSFLSIILSKLLSAYF